MKLLKLLFLFIFLSSSNLYAEIYKLNCKYTEQIGAGDKSVKTSVWYINNEKKMIALAKINNNNVKYTSNKWDDKSFGVKNNEVLINRSQMKIKNNIYEVGASGDKGKGILVMAMSKEGLDKDPTWIKLEKDTEKLVKSSREKKISKAKYEKQIEKIHKLNGQIVAKWTIQQLCSKPIKVKSAKKDPLNKVKDKIKKTLDKIN